MNAAIADDRPLSRKAIVWLSIGVFVLLFGRSVNKNLDPDEHQFVAPPALLIQDHLLPYVDYPYFHMPNLIFIYAALTGWTSYKLLAARTVMTLCGTGTVVLLIVTAHNTLRGKPSRTRWAVAGGLGAIFVCCRMFTYTDGWAWNHDMPVLCTLAAFLLHVRGMRQARVLPIVIAGFLLGMAMGIRLSFALAPIPFVLSLILGASPLTWWRRFVALLLGIIAALVAVSPAIWFLLVEREKFIFGNLGYPHLSTEYYRSIGYDHGLTLPGKLLEMLKKFSFDPGNAALLVLFVLAVFHLSFRTGSLRRKSPWHNEIMLLAALLIALCVGTLGPTPIQPQYCYALVPFMVLMIAYGVSTIVQKKPDNVSICPRVIAALALTIGAIMIPAEYWKVIFLFTPGCWTPIQQHRTAEWIRTMTGPNARIMTIETAVPLEAGLKVYPEYAVGRFVFLVGKFQSEEDRRKYGMFSRADLPVLLAQRPPDAIFCPSPWDLDEWAEKHRFRKIVYDDHHVLWVPMTDPATQKSQ